MNLHAGVLLSSALLLSQLTSVRAAEGKPHVWQCWQATLTSAKDYASPLTDITLRVTFTGPGGVVNGLGFWDGGRTFRIRCAFPCAGRWQWRTTCSDTDNAGLHDQHGTVDVVAYAGGNPLYRHGFLRVSSNQRYLAHADGTPFLWMGDTAWGAPLNATQADWETYLDNRAAKGFSVVQIAPASAWVGNKDALGNAPFEAGNSTRPNPAYWQRFERKVQSANDKGLVVLLVGVMEPVSRYPKTDQAQAFARYIAARLFGNFVIFSPSFDSPYMDLGDAVGRTLREATAVHLITQHPGTQSGLAANVAAETYFDKPYLDFSGDQSGHNNGDRERGAAQAINWNLHLYHHSPPKPVINLEAMYDGQGKTAWSADDARGLGYRSWLSGALGYTYGAGETDGKVPNGAGGLYVWVNNPAKYDYWRKAVDWPSAWQMQYLRTFFAGLEWWRLAPAHELLQNQPAGWIQKRVLAKSDKGDFAVAYLPDPGPVTIDLTGFPGAMRGRWFNPVNNQWTAVDGELPRQTVTLTPPGPGDWVLLLKAAH
jgi:hypothetical protein